MIRKTGGIAPAHSSHRPNKTLKDAHSGQIAQLKSRKRKLEDQISSTKRDIEEAKQILKEVEQIQYIQRDLKRQIENERSNLGC